MLISDFKYAQAFWIVTIITLGNLYYLKCSSSEIYLSKSEQGNFSLFVLMGKCN